MDAAHACSSSLRGYAKQWSCEQFGWVSPTYPDTQSYQSSRLLVTPTTLAAHSNPELAQGPAESKPNVCDPELGTCWGLLGDNGVN